LKGARGGGNPVPRIERQQAAGFSKEGRVPTADLPPPHRRFDQQDFGAIARKRPRQHRGGHPPGETATDHQ